MFDHTLGDAVRAPPPGYLAALDLSRIGAQVFLFFSNRLGCAGSLVLSLLITALLIVILWR